MGAFDGSLGAFLVGTLFSTFLLGVTATQAFTYFVNFGNSDRRIYFWVVTVLLIMDWAHTALSCYTIYLWLVQHFGDVAYLAISPWSFAVDPAMTGVVASIVQAFYAYRVYVVSKRSLALPILITFFSAVQLGFACGATGMVFKLKDFAKFQSWTYGVTIWLVSAAVCDILITGSLVFHLRKSKTGMLQTNSVCDKLIELIIQSNGLTCVAAIINAVLFATLSSSYHVVLNLCLIKLYFNSLLVSLNARADLGKHLGPHSQGNSRLDFQDTSSQSYAFGNRSSVRVLPAAKVHVTTLRTVTTDKYDDSDPERLCLGGEKAEMHVLATRMRRKESDGGHSATSGATLF